MPMPAATIERALFAGLLLFGLSLPLSKSASTVLLVALYLTAGLAALGSRDFRGAVARNGAQPLTVALALFFCVALAGVLYSESFSEGLAAAGKYLSLPAVYYIVASLIQTAREPEARIRVAEGLLCSFLAGVAALDALGVLAFVGAIGDQAFALPLTSLHLHHIWFSNLNALGCYTAASLLLFGRCGASLRARIYLGCFLLLSSLCIALSMSRTAWLSFALTAATMSALTVRRKRTVWLLLAGMTLAAAAVYQFVPVVRDRIDLIASDLELFIASSKKASSLGARLWMWKAALKMFQANPLFGVGTGDYIHAMEEFRRLRLLPRYLLDYNQPHNIYLLAMATNGMLGLASLLFIFHRSVRLALPALRAQGGERLFAFLALATVAHFMVAGLFDSFFNIQILRYSFAFIMGVCLRGSAGPGPPR